MNKDIKIAQRSSPIRSSEDYNVTNAFETFETAPNYFITGTDTGIGKTVFSTILALKLGYHYWKPIQSGLEEITDSEWVAERIGKPFVKPEIYRLSQPLSPHAAAKLENQEIKIDPILSAAPQDHTIIEGCGGLLVPMNSSTLIIDLIQQLKCSLILVARSGLGTINHTLLSLEALQQRSIPILGVVLIGPPNSSNREAIEHFGKTPVIAEVPFLENLSRDSLISFSHQLSLNLASQSSLTSLNFRSSHGNQKFSDHIDAKL